MNINSEFIASIQNHLLQLRRLHAKSIRGKPWFILLGPARSGKTSFLRHAQLAVQHILSPDDPNIQTWICENALYIDIQTRSITAEQLQQTWDVIAQTVREHKGRQKLSGLILALPLYDLMNQTKLQRDAIISDYKTIAAKFAENTSTPLAIYTLFSQCDRIAGFCEYFNDLELTQRQTPCGFILKSQPLTSDEFADEFDQLLKNLHDSLIQRLHRVHNAHERARINDFALQFESIKDIIVDAMTQLSDSENALESRGCFFISNVQDGMAEDRLSKQLEQTFTLRSKAPADLTFTAQAYFTHQLANKVIPSDQQLPPTPGESMTWLKGIGSHVAMIGLSSGLLLALTMTYWHQRNMSQNIKVQLAQYQIHKPILAEKLSPDELRRLVASLNKLQRTETAIHRAAKRWPNLLPFSHFSQTTKEFDQTYRNELSQELYARFANYIDHTLTDMGNDDPDAIYATLKAYLMLSNSEHRDGDFLVHWLSQRLDITDIANKLKPMLSDNGIQISLNQETVTEARNFLADLPPATLGMVILKSQSPVSPNHVPEIFTKVGFQKAADKQIIKVAEQVLSGDWVIGQANSSHSMSVAGLVEEIHKQYPAEYVKWWQQFLVSVNFPALHTLDEAIEALRKVTQAQTHLVTMIEQMHQETSPMTGTDEVSAQFNREIASQFSGFDAGSYQHLGSLNNSFKELYTSLQAIANSPDQNTASLQFVQDAFRTGSHSGISALVHQSEHLPSPLDLWVTQVIDECWQIVLPKAQGQLETLWHHHVATEFSNLIAGRYPIDVRAKTELSLPEFNHFFAPGGTLDIFVSQYLKDFINTESPTWKAKQLGALEFPLTPSLLETLVRAKLIRQMFFPDQSTTAKIGFNLTPLRLDPIIKDLVMDIDGQTLFASPGSSKTTHLNWPGPHSRGEINLIFNNIDGSKSFITEVGPWAWFKLLSKVDIKRMDSPQQFQVTFNLNGNAARYELSADTVVNPYLANIVTGFNLPGELFAHADTGLQDAG